MSRYAARAAKRNRAVGLGMATFGGVMFVFPMWLARRAGEQRREEEAGGAAAGSSSALVPSITRVRLDSDKALSPQASMRGPYINTGTRDIGLDHAARQRMLTGAQKGAATRTPAERRDYFRTELAQFDGAVDRSGPVLLGLDGVVYDVSADDGSVRFGPGQPLNCLLGRDATVALATQKFDASVLPASCDAPVMMLLSDANLEELQRWKDAIAGDYPVVGVLKSPGDRPRAQPGDIRRAALASFDGVQSADSPILIAIDGVVFDVGGGDGLKWYGPGQAYSVFAGRDASMALATNSLDASLLPASCPRPDLSRLSDGERESLASWKSHFLKKYPVVGNLID